MHASLAGYLYTNTSTLSPPSFVNTEFTEVQFYHHALHDVMSQLARSEIFENDDVMRHHRTAPVNKRSVTRSERSLLRHRRRVRSPLEIDLMTSTDVVRECFHHVAYCRNEDGDTLLHIALICDQPSHVIHSIVLSATVKSDLDAQNRKFQTPLHLAVLMNRPDVADILLSAGASVDLQDDLGRTPFHIAVSKDHRCCLATLARHLHHQSSYLSDIVNRFDYSGNSCLHSAVKLANCHVINQLVSDCGADVNLGNGLRGSTALHIAVLVGNAELVKCIMGQPNVDVDRVTWDGKTALDIAINSRGLDDIEAMLRMASSCSKLEPDYDSSDLDDDQEMNYCR